MFLKMYESATFKGQWRGIFLPLFFVGSTIYGAEISRLKQFLFVFVFEKLLKVFYGSPFPTSGYSGDSS
jgi:hypothetical protein